LVEWINPGRHYLPALTLALLVSAGGMLWRASLKYQKSQVELLETLVTRDTAPLEVVGAVSFVIFGLGFLILFGWCWWYLPRAPQTFSPNVANFETAYAAALRHYVRWSGGLDYAAVFEIRGPELKRIAEGFDDRDIRRGLQRVAGAPAPSGDSGSRTVADQKQAWEALARAIVKGWDDFDRHVALAGQGRTVGVSFNMWYGAVYVEILSQVQPVADKPAVGFLLFAACLNQHEVNTFAAPKHFAMLSQAIRHIRSGITRA
jgi:hypothetical protein